MATHSTPKSANEGIKIIEEPDRLTHQAIREEVNINRYHLTLVLERLKQGSRIPTYSDAWPWFFVFLALLLALIPTDFQDFAGLSAETWQAIAVILLVGSFAKVAWSLFQGYQHRHERAETAEEAVQKIIDQITTDRQKLSE